MVGVGGGDQSKKSAPADSGGDEVKTNAKRACAYQIANIACEILKDDVHQGKVVVAESSDCR